MPKRVNVSSRTFWRSLHRSWRLATAIAILITVVWQFVYSSLYAPAFSGWNFFSFFTIQSNLIGAVAFIWLVFARQRSTKLELFRGGATLYLTITGIVFALLLSNAEVGLTLPGVDVVLHKLVPLIILLDWLLDPPHARFALQKVLLWFIYPMAWLAYTLVRGAAIGWYPYPFLDPREPQGYASVAMYGAGIFVGAVLVSLVLLWGAHIRLRLKVKKRP